MSVIGRHADGGKTGEAIVAAGVAVWVVIGLVIGLSFLWRPVVTGN